MINQEAYRNLKQTMTQEWRLLKCYSDSLTPLYQGISEKDWPSMEISLEKIAPLVERILSLDKVRTDQQEVLFVSTPPSEKRRSFYAKTMTLPRGERQEISALFRKLKLEWIRAKTINHSLSEMMASRIALLRKLLEGFNPATKGRTYTDCGAPSNREVQPLLVSGQY